MKCLEKDRTRRYETASALAGDVERYLHDEPVQACPPSARYRFGKFARRYKAALATVAAVIAALVLGTAVSTWQAIRASNAEAQANSSAKTADEALDFIVSALAAPNRTAMAQPLPSSPCSTAQLRSCKEGSPTIRTPKSICSSPSQDVTLA